MAKSQECTMHAPRKHAGHTRHGGRRIGGGSDVITLLHPRGAATGHTDGGGR